MQEENAGNQLGELLKEHADRKMKRREITPEENIRVICMLDEYEESYPVGLARYESRNPIEVRLQNITKVLETVEDLIKSGFTIKELSEKKVISEANYRKYKEERENLSIILDGVSKRGE